MQQNTYSDTSSGLLDAIKANKEAALKQFYQEEYPKTERYVREKGGTAEQAKDIFQEAFIAVWRNVQLEKVQLDNGAKLSAYLYQVAKNKWIDYLRSGHYKNTMAVSDLHDGFDTADELPEEQHQYLEAVKIAFKQLSENCKEVLNRFYYKNESVLVIAEAMEWTEATVRNNKYRCMERLRDMLKKK